LPHVGPDIQNPIARPHQFREAREFGFVRAETASRQFDPVFRGAQPLPRGQWQMGCQALQKHFLPELSQKAISRRRAAV